MAYAALLLTTVAFLSQRGVQKDNKRRTTGYDLRFRDRADP